VAKILVADDNSNIQKMVGLALKDQGIDVVAVGNGEAAVRKISDVHPDLVLADVFMPVRNGYEVCRYVKEDSALSHIPVILLVGAFDPLDEQEAQRVGADGVLKKPFVPPDPLISMVKSALTRAGVTLGPPPAKEKPAAAPSRGPAEIFSPGFTSKLAALSPEGIPEAAAEPLEEFATPREQVKIAAGQEPLAFGNLLETKEEEVDPAMFSSAKPMIELATQRNWSDEPAEVPEEEEEEESSHEGWRPDGLDAMENAAASTKGQTDWRDEAFHGSSPAKSISSSPHWQGGATRPDQSEAAAPQAPAVTTMERKPEGGASPFAGDAWAAAMAAGVEEKIAAMKEEESAVPEVTALPPLAEEKAAELPGTMAASLESASEQSPTVAEEAKATEPANWAPIPESSWEVDARRASLLASTWDAPAPVSSEATQEASAPGSEQAPVHAESPAESSAYLSQPDLEHLPAEQVEAPAEEPPAEPVSVAPELTNWASAWQAPVVAPPLPAIPEVHAEPEQLGEHAPEPEVAQNAAAVSAAQPDMDELVARVLGKMNPDVLQKVTREILKPVVEAIIRDELNSKKS